MKRYILYLACGNFPEELLSDLDAECTYASLWDKSPRVPIWTDFPLFHLPLPFPRCKTVELDRGESDGGQACYYMALVPDAVHVHAFARARAPDQCAALTVLSDCCNEYNCRLYLHFL